MIIFKIALIILLAAPFIGMAAFLFWKARSYSVKLNREDKYNKEYAKKYRQPDFSGRSSAYDNRYTGFIDE